ncbi:6862_t:CDS:2 [Cetraspora pellucida]|uniref:6862_t:CDS:1 n=1 Tax=Cetraspora pellucida TaxID=1433469 RepID=A0A9N9I7Y2_9GLOM|nr:6862_t:CDS:2 [Cetraspora pellucida]
MINNIARKQTHIGELLGEKLALQLIYQRCKAKGDDISDFLVKLRLYLQNQGVNPADNAGGPPTGREVAMGYLRGSNIVAVNGYTAIQIGANGINEALNQPGNAIVKLRAVEGSWDENWRIAGGRPTNNAPNAPNANAGNTVVAPEIHFGQAVWWLKTHFPTVEEELRDIMYGTIKKENITIDELYRKILRIGRRANYRSEKLHRKFLDALLLPWFEKAEDIDEHLLLDELAKKLYEIELCRIARHKKDKIPNSLVSQQASREIYELLPISASQQQGISLEDMQKAIQNALA